MSYRLQIWPAHSHDPSDPKPIKNFGKKAAWALLGTTQCFKYPFIISEAGIVTDFKFCMHIHGIDLNKSPLKIFGKVAVGILRDSQKLSWHPHIGRIVQSS